jgi:hypothetical protein
MKGRYTKSHDMKGRYTKYVVPPVSSACESSKRRGTKAAVLQWVQQLCGTYEVRWQPCCHRLFRCSGMCGIAGLCSFGMCGIPSRCSGIICRYHAYPGVITCRYAAVRRPSSSALQRNVRHSCRVFPAPDAHPAVKQTTQGSSLSWVESNDSCAGFSSIRRIFSVDAKWR